MSSGVPFLPAVPTFGTMIGQALGGGLGEGLSEGLTNQLAQFQKREASKKQLKGLTPFLKDFIPEESIPGLIESGIEPKNILDLAKFVQGQKQLEEYKKSINISEEQPDQGDTFKQSMQPESGEEFGTSFQQPLPTSTQSIPIEQPSVGVKPVLASKQVPLPTSVRDIPAHTTARLQAKQLGFNQNKKLIESIDSDSKKAKELRPLIKRAAQLVQKGGVSGLSGKLQSELGESIPFIKSPDLAEFQRLQKEMTVGNFRTDFGARPAQSEFFYITDVYGRPGDTKEALYRKLILEDWKAQIKEKREEAKNDVFRKYEEYPLNLNELIEAKLKPTYDKYLEKTGYNKWVKEQQKAKPLTDDIMKDYLRKNNNDPQKAFEALQKDNYKVVE